MRPVVPHPAHAEDQPYARIILYLHVMRASAMSFSFFSLAQFPASLIAARYNKRPIDYNVILARTLKTASRGLLLGTAAGAIMTWGRMRGREEIEWKDRSWRILENDGEVQTDWISAGSAGAGAIAALMAVRRGRISMPVSGAVLGGTGVGMAVGVPYMIGTYAAGRKPA
ncbi:hypothetical protein yc1106_07946 [Curvularia clavata]|uniref:Uncharacterized protein n=1 Tax=Curvularia clavata TaxID=95742 RepID=A0A9Q8ZES4_CURCL|nr:hypothetical protein yc1106_07946 [Curvularia clavata]